MYPALTEIKSGSPQGPGAGLRRFFREIIFTKNIRENDLTEIFFHKLENITHHYRDFSSPANSSGFIWNQNIKQIKNCFFKKSKILYKIKLFFSELHIENMYHFFRCPKWNHHFFPIYNRSESFQIINSNYLQLEVFELEKLKSYFREIDFTKKYCHFRFDYSIIQATHRFDLPRFEWSAKSIQKKK